MGFMNSLPCSLGLFYITVIYDRTIFSSYEDPMGFWHLVHYFLGFGKWCTSHCSCNLMTGPKVDSVYNGVR